VFFQQAPELQCRHKLALSRQARIPPERLSS
jgi:hypothetical protein